MWNGINRRKGRALLTERWGVLWQDPLPHKKIDKDAMSSAHWDKNFGHCPRSLFFGGGGGQKQTRKNPPSHIFHPKRCLKTFQIKKLFLNCSKIEYF